MAAGVQSAKPGTSEREVAAAVSHAVIMAGSDRADPGPLSSGDRAFLLHGTYTDRVLAVGDTLHLETIPCVRQYHARFMRTIKVGRAEKTDEDLARRLMHIQDRAIAEVGPGVSAAVPDRICREGIRATALLDRYTNKTFYSVGLHFPPNGAEFLEAVAGATWKFEAGPTFHTYLGVRGFAFSETILVTPDGSERLTTYPREILIS